MANRNLAISFLALYLTFVSLSPAPQWQNCDIYFSPQVSTQDLPQSYICLHDDLLFVILSEPF